MENNFKKQVFAKIHKKEVLMRSRSYFVMQVIATWLLALLVFVIAALTLSFIIFSVHESGEQFLLTFGGEGVFTFVKLFPWTMSLVTLLLVFLLELLLQRFKFGYSVPITRIFIYLTIITMFASLIISFTPLHGKLLKEAEMNKLPIIGEMYDSIKDSHQPEGVLRGAVTSIQSASFTLSHDDKDKDKDDGQWEVVPPSDFDLTSLYIGEEVYVAGNIMDKTVFSYGIKELPSEN